MSLSSGAYLEDYHVGDERNKKANQVNDKRKSMPKKENDFEIKDP